MIVAAELQMQGNKHVGVNSSMLEILEDTFNQDIIVYCDDFHQSSLRSNCDFKTVIWNLFKYTGDKELKKKSIPSKIIREVLLAFTIFKFSKKNDVELIFFFSAYPFTQIFLNLFAYLFNQKIVLCQHGDLGVLTMKNPKLLSRIFGFVQEFFFRFRSSNSIVLFYGESVKDLFFKKYPKFRNTGIVCIDHPYCYSSEEINKQGVVDNVVTIAGIGTGLLNKNSHYIFELAKYFEKEVGDRFLDFRHVGNVSNEVIRYQNNLVDIVGGAFIDVDSFENEVTKADLFVYFFEKDSLYDLCPSGTFFDAIKYERPILALDNPFFSYYFNKLGKIGWLFKDVEEMSVFISEVILSNDDLEFFLKPIKNQLKLSKEKLSINSISDDFSKQISHYVKIR